MRMNIKLLIQLFKPSHIIWCKWMTLFYHIFGCSHHLNTTSSEKLPCPSTIHKKNYQVVLQQRCRMDKQNQNRKRNNIDDNDFYCAKFRNDPSFLWDDDMNGKARRFTSNFKHKSPLLYPHILNIILHQFACSVVWKQTNVSCLSVPCVNKLLSKITQIQISTYDTWLF